jgi:hypothetical protein
MGWFIPIAISLAAAATQYAGAKKAQDKMDSTAEAELLRQRKYSGEGAATFKKSLSESGSEQAGKQIGAGAAAMQQRYEGMPALGTSAAPSLAGSPSTSVEAAGRNQLTSMSNVARARLMGYNEWDVNQALKNLRAQQALGVTSGLSQASEQPLGMEIQQASHAGDTLQGIGRLLGAVGGVAGMMSSAGGSAGGGAVPASQKAAMYNEFLGQGGYGTSAWGGPWLQQSFRGEV